MVPYVPHAPARARRSRGRPRRCVAPHRRAHLSRSCRSSIASAASTPTTAAEHLERGLGGRRADRAIRAGCSTPTSSIPPATRSPTPRPTSAPGCWRVPAWGFTGNPYLAHNTVGALRLRDGGGRRLLPGALPVGQPRGGGRGRRALRLLPVRLRAHGAHPAADDVRACPSRCSPSTAWSIGRRPGRAVTLGVVLCAQALSCAYYGIFAGLMVGLGTLVFAVDPRPVALAALLGAHRRWRRRCRSALTVPFFLPYLAGAG